MRNVQLCVFEVIDESYYKATTQPPHPLSPLNGCRSSTSLRWSYGSHIDSDNVCHQRKAINFINEGLYQLTSLFGSWSVFISRQTGGSDGRNVRAGWDYISQVDSNCMASHGRTQEIAWENCVNVWRRRKYLVEEYRHGVQYSDDIQWGHALLQHCQWILSVSNALWRGHL